MDFIIKVESEVYINPENGGIDMCNNADEKKLYLGIDIGGTNVAYGVVDERGNMLHKASVKTEKGAENIVKASCDGIRRLLGENNIDISSVAAAGIGSAGLIDSKNGIIVYAGNLDFKNVHITKMFEDELGIPCHVENDANAAAYGEYMYEGKNVSSFIFLTFGTGIGGGIIIDGKIFDGFNGAGAELGHMLLNADGKQCGCGRKGCWEAYASATALIEQTKEMMQLHPESNMTKFAREKGKVSGMTAFQSAKTGDKYGKEVVNNYIRYVSEGILNIINIFQPEEICLGGGISNEGDYFLNPIKEYVVKYAYTGELKKPEIKIASLFNDAGIIGAALSAAKK